MRHKPKESQMKNKCCEHCDCNRDEEVAPTVKIAIEALERVCLNGEYAEQVEAATRLLNFDRGY